MRRSVVHSYDSVPVVEVGSAGDFPPVGPVLVSNHEATLRHAQKACEMFKRPSLKTQRYRADR